MKKIKILFLTILSTIILQTDTYGKTSIEVNPNLEHDIINYDETIDMKEIKVAAFEPVAGVFASLEDIIVNTPPAEPVIIEENINLATPPSLELVEVEVIQTPPYSQDDFRLMCGIIWAEARGESAEGQKAVGIVIQNRIENNQFPSTLEGVIYQKGQFMPTWNGALNKGLSAFDNNSIDESIKAAAEYALCGNKTINPWNYPIDMSSYLYFNANMKSPKLELGGHGFK